MLQQKHHALLHQIADAKRQRTLHSGNGKIEPQTLSADGKKDTCQHRSKGAEKGLLSHFLPFQKTPQCQLNGKRRRKPCASLERCMGKCPQSDRKPDRPKEPPLSEKGGKIGKPHRAQQSHQLNPAPKQPHQAEAAALQQGLPRKRLFRLLFRQEHFAEVRCLFRIFQCDFCLFHTASLHTPILNKQNRFFCQNGARAERKFRQKPLRFIHSA